MSIVHCLGDSHVSIFNGAGVISMPPEFPFTKDCNPNFHTYNIGPVIAYNLNSPTHKWNNLVVRALNKIPKSDYLMFSAGQIDCSNHLPKQKLLQKDRLYDDIIKECVNRYVEYLLKIKNMGYNKIIAYGPIVSHPCEGVPNCVEDKIYANKIFTDYLKIVCTNNNILHITMYDKLLNENNEVKMELYMDTVHLSIKAISIVEDEFKKLGII